MLNVEGSLNKLRSKLFSRFSPEEYGIDLDSQITLPGSEYYQSVGGFEFRVSNSKVHRVEIKHDGKTRFSIYTFEMVPAGLNGDPKEQSKVAVTTDFAHVDSVLMHVLRPSWNPDGSPRYR